MTTPTIEEMVEDIEYLLREEVSCLICGGEMCNCDGSHDEERRKELAQKIVNMFYPSLTEK